MSEYPKVALITGANRGIGRAVAALLAAAGFSVVVGARDARRGAETAAVIRGTGGDAHSVELDVTNRSTVQAAASWIDDHLGRLDVLVNNAGITGSGQAAPQDALDRVPSAVEVELVREVFDTNVFAVITVTNAMLPLLRRAPAARIVNVSSHSASLALTAEVDGPMSKLISAAYSPSKTALNALTLQYANELRTQNILVNAAAPGYVDTDINGHSGLLTPEQGAAVVVRLATLGVGGQTGGFFSEDGPLPW